MKFFKVSVSCMSPSSEESDERTQPPTPPPRHFLRKSGGSFRLPCLTKQASHEKPPAGESPDRNLMSRIAASLRFSPLPVMAVAGIAPEEDGSLSPVDRRNHVPLHRASYHGPSKYVPEMNGIEIPNNLQKYNPDERVIGSAENLVGRVLQEQGLGRYCDPEFVKATQRELAEAINLTPEELDRAAHRLMQAERRSSNPYLYQPTQVPNDNTFLSSLQDERPSSQQTYHTDTRWDDKHFGDTRL